MDLWCYHSNRIGLIMAELSYTKLLSGSTNGRPIKVVATATAGTAIHTTPSVAGTQDVHDQIFIYATNTHASTAADLTIEFGGVTSPDDLLLMNIAAGVGPVLVVPGFLLNNNLSVGAFASVANIINITGYVCRMPVNSSGMTNLQ